jgi:hypothetical protein
VDAARKETFEKLRRLGRYEPFLENMRFLRQLRRSGIIPELKFSFTYQLDSFREIPEFVDFRESMNCDFAIFGRLQNIAFSWDEFRSKAVHYSDHPLYPEFIGVVSDPRFASPRVWHDFDYGGRQNADGGGATANEEIPPRPEGPRSKCCGHSSTDVGDMSAECHMMLACCQPTARVSYNTHSGEHFTCAGGVLDER